MSTGGTILRDHIKAMAGFEKPVEFHPHVRAARQSSGARLVRRRRQLRVDG